MAFTPYSAKNAKIRVGAVVLTAKKWTVTPATDALETTNFEGTGFYECVGGITKATVTIELDDDGQANLWDAASNTLRPGGRAATVKLYQNDTTGPFWSFPTLFIEQTPQNADVKQQMQNTIQGVGSGSFLYPTGSASP